MNEIARALLGRERAVDCLRQALLERRSLLILGPAGSGKTALVRTAVDYGAVFLDYSSSLHRLLTDLSRALIRSRHRRFLSLARITDDVDLWLARQTSVHLKGLLWTSLEGEPGTIVIDGIDGASVRVYRFFQRLYFARGMVLIATARDAVSLDALGRLFWDPRTTLHLGPLGSAEAARLFEISARDFGLDKLDLEDFREKALESARGNPGQIIEMCRMASNPIYVSGRHIKFAPLRIDALMKFVR